MALFGNVALERKLLEGTYEDTVRVLRPDDETVGNITGTVLKEAGGGICALSQSGNRAASQTDSFNRLEYEAVVFAPPELDVRPGDVLEVTRFGRTDPASQLVYTYEPAGRPAHYPTHQEIPLKVVAIA